MVWAAGPRKWDSRVEPAVGTAENFYTLPNSVKKNLFAENENKNALTYRLSKKNAENMD